jgi:Raf kinase inhibitor-like YbhB/YbcL family protein
MCLIGGSKPGGCVFELPWSARLARRGFTKKDLARSLLHSIMMGRLQILALLSFLVCFRVESWLTRIPLPLYRTEFGLSSRTRREWFSTSLERAVDAVAASRPSTTTQLDLSPESRREWLLTVTAVASTAIFQRTAWAAEKFTLSSSAFENGGAIPSIYTRCDGNDLSPPLTWKGVPPNTRSLTLIVDDPDAPDPAAPRMTWVHWVLYNIPPTSSQLEKGVSVFPPGTKEALNDWKTTGYGGPSPPKGRHRYFHKLYALDTVLQDLGSGATKQSVLKAMEGHILGQTELVGTYQKK